MRALITGGFGFAGLHLAQYLASCGDDVALTYLPSTKTEINKAVLPRTAQSIALDVTDKKAVGGFIQLAQPETIYHLAAKTFVPDAENDIDSYLETNLRGTLNLLEGIVAHSPTTKFLYVSSAEVYGDPWPGSLPYTETSNLRPANNYGVTKVAADAATFKFAHYNGVQAVRVRPFPHIGPGQNEKFAISSFAKQVAEIKLGKREPIIKVGNLEAKRDYSDVSDIVRGYRDALLNGKRGEAYNLCSGQSVMVGDLLKKLIAIAEIEAEIVVDPERYRPVDIPELYGSSQKALKDFGWKPRINLDGTLSSLFAYWMEQVAAAK
jgi:GDP-4-dehydro-6-deoxy-D-mannose reductase